MARTKKQNIEEKDSITCEINKDLKITLKKIVETFRHDDSLPFNAELYVQSTEQGFLEITRIGRVWNDGWGGDSVIESSTYLKFLETLDRYLTIYRKLTHVNILELEDCEEVVPEPEMPKVDQKYNYAECLVQKPLDTEVVTIALSTRNYLGIKKGSALDKKIFHYCNGYEEFLTLLIKEPIFASPEDFSIKSVNKLY